MNLNKYTKAELISKLRKSESNSDLSTISSTNTLWKRFVSYFNEIITLLRLIQEVVLKITMITFLYKFFKKFPIIRKLGLYLYKILFSITGFSLANHFGVIDIFTHYWSSIELIFENIIEYVKNIYKTIKEYFYGKEEPEINEPEYPHFRYEDNPISDETNKSRKNIEYICYALILTTVACIIWFYWDDVYSYFGGNAPSDGNNGGNKVLFDIEDESNNFNTKLKEHVSEVINRKDSITSLQTDILSKDELNKILKNPDLKDGDQVYKAIKDAITDAKGKKVMSTLTELEVPSNIKPSSNIGTTSWNDPYSRIKETLTSNNSLIEKRDIDLINTSKFTPVGTDDNDSLIEIYEYQSSSTSSDKTVRPESDTQKLIKSVDPNNSNPELLLFMQNWKDHVTEDIKNYMAEIEDIINNPLKNNDSLINLTNLFREIDDKNELFFKNANLIGKSLDININKKQFIWSQTDSWISEKYKELDKIENLINNYIYYSF